MSGILKTLANLGIAAVVFACGATAVTATYFLARRGIADADKLLAPGGAELPEPPTIHVRYVKWLERLTASQFSELGAKSNGTPVVAILAESLPRTALLAFSAWILAWSGGLILAGLFTTRWKSAGQWFRDRGYPAFQAVPPIALILLAYILFLKGGFVSIAGAGFAAAILVLGGLMLPGTTVLWLNGITRVLEKDFVVEAQARGLTVWVVWRRHVARHVLLSSGIPVAAAIGLAGALAGSLVIERVFALGGGLGTVFVEAVTNAEADLAATASALVFTTTAVAVLAARALTLFLDPNSRSEKQ